MGTALGVVENSSLPPHDFCWSMVVFLVLDGNGFISHQDTTEVLTCPYGSPFQRVKVEAVLENWYG